MEIMGRRGKVYRIIFTDDGLLVYPYGCVNTAESAVWQLQYTVDFLHLPSHTHPRMQGCVAMVGTSRLSQGTINTL